MSVLAFTVLTRKTQAPKKHTITHLKKLSVADLALGVYALNMKMTKTRMMIASGS